MKPSGSRSDLVFSAVLMAPNFKFIRQKYGEEMERRLYEIVGMRREDFEDEDRWVSYETCLGLNHAMVELTGNPNIPYEAGLHHAYTSEVGLSFFAVKKAVSPAWSYRFLPAATRHLSRVTAYEVLEYGEDFARLRFTVHPDYKDDPLFDLKRQGTLASVTIGHGLPPARVVEEACIHKGAPACIYYVTWDRPRKRRFVFAGLLGLLLGLLLGVALGSPWLGTIAGLLVFGAGWFSHLVATPRGRLGESADLVESEAKRLHEMIQRNDAKSQRLELLWEISDLLHRAQDEQTLIQTATDMVRRRLDFDRVLFWGVGGGRLEVAHGSGISDDLKEAFQRLWVPLKPGQRDTPPVVALFGPMLEQGKGTVVRDCAAYRAGLSARGQQLFDTIAPGPFVAVPVPKGDQGGILAADRREPSTVTEHDLFMLEQVANQLGLALENVRLLEKERAARETAEASLERERKLSLYLNPEVRDRLGSSETVLAEEILVAVLFIDVVGFSKVADIHPPRVTLAWLNQLFALADQVLEQKGGIIDKRLGDGILAVFRGDDAARRALEASAELHGQVHTLDQDLDLQGISRIRLRCGLSHGLVVAGTIGTAIRYEYTVIGRVVNLAQRLQAHGVMGETVLSLPAWEAAGSPPEALHEESWKFHGFKEPVPFRRIKHQTEAPETASAFVGAELPQVSSGAL